MPHNSCPTKKSSGFLRSSQHFCTFIVKKLHQIEKLSMKLPKAPGRLEDFWPGEDKGVGGWWRTGPGKRGRFLRSKVLNRIASCSSWKFSIMVHELSVDWFLKWRCKWCHDLTSIASLSKKTYWTQFLWTKFDPKILLTRMFSLTFLDSWIHLHFVYKKKSHPPGGSLKKKQTFPRTWRIKRPSHFFSCCSNFFTLA